MNCIVVTEEGCDLLHIESVTSTVLTLCGFVDVPYKEVDGIPNCPSCLALVEYCKKLRIPKQEVK